MKRILCGLAITGSLISADGFSNDVKYTCLNTQVVKSGQTTMVEEKEAKKNPFVFSITGDKLKTKENQVFDFKMARGGMKSYSNDKYMLLLMPDKKLGLVPKDSRGRLQYYFQCK